MGTQEYRANYRAAMQEANSHLAEIFREFEDLQLRKELLEDVLGALEPFLESAALSMHESPRQEFVRPQTARYEPEAPVATASVPVQEVVRPAPFAPASDVIVDPIQSRINRALGLAVA